MWQRNRRSNAKSGSWHTRCIGAGQLSARRCVITRQGGRGACPNDANDPTESPGVQGSTLERFRWRVSPTASRRDHHGVGVWAPRVHRGLQRLGSNRPRRSERADSMRKGMRRSPGRFRARERAIGSAVEHPRVAPRASLATECVRRVQCGATAVLIAKGPGGYRSASCICRRPAWSVAQALLRRRYKNCVQPLQKRRIGGMGLRC